MRGLIAVWMLGVLRMADRMRVRLNQQDPNPATALEPMSSAALADVVGQTLFWVGDQTSPRALSAMPEKTSIN